MEDRFQINIDKIASYLNMICTLFNNIQVS